MSIAQKIAVIRQARKAISYKPELEGRVHILSQEAGQAVAELEGYTDYCQVYGVYTWVRKAIDKIADNLAPLPVRVVEGDGEALDDHAISRLLATGNDSTNPADLWRRWVVHMMLGGEAFLEVVGSRPGGGGKPLELWPRRPDWVKVLPDVAPERRLYPRVAGYLYSQEGGRDEVAIEPEAMVHSRFYNPLSPWRGLAPIAAVREGITIDLFAQAWSKRFLKQGARPDYAVIAPEGITRTEREDLQAQLMQEYSGAENWHKPIVLEQRITDIRPFSFAPKDIEWLEQRKFSRDEVGAIFGVPDEIMGFGRDTYENFETALKVLWVLTLVPLAGHRDMSLTHFFSRVRADLKPGQRIETDLSAVGVLQEDIGPKLEHASRLWAMAVPFNVIDERLKLGIGPIPGGDVGYLPYALMPLTPAALDRETTAGARTVTRMPTARDRRGRGPPDESQQKTAGAGGAAIRRRSGPARSTAHRNTWPSGRCL
jgi:HK97 family phage portal protein